MEAIWLGVNLAASNLPVADTGNPPVAGICGPIP